VHATRELISRIAGNLITRICMELPFYIVDVFAEEKYSGNQLAVFPDAGDISGPLMQQIAREMHFSETTFVTGSGRGEDSYDVRIFTPEHEIPFAGHPVLGTAFVIREESQGDKIQSICLNLAAGRIPVSFRCDNGQPEVLWMRQNNPEFLGSFTRDALSGVLSVPESAFERDLPIEAVSTGLPFLIVPMRRLSDVQKVRINRAAYDSLIDQSPAKGVLVFSRETCHPENNLHVRMFADYYGVSEDPATGSAAGCLAAYLLIHGHSGDGPVDARLEQGYEMHRPSLIRCRAGWCRDKIDVDIGGRVMLVAKGVFV